MTTILLVDDEKLVQRSLEKTLLRAGYDVLTAADCRSGWEIFQTNADTIDLAVFDLNMPDFTGLNKPGAGLDLLQKVLEARPALPTIVLTAYDEVNKARDAMALGARAYFVKGREQGLVELIQGILGKQE
ncbi:MAG: response regulator [Anaerolineales bacterium]|nr:response regulator [Anaerolineales bacterium]MCX7756643.1 response regulator [Anaerolineales bacterium]MDW8277282.1 response regulator [Anaerolineales bacterium]